MKKTVNILTLIAVIVFCLCLTSCDSAPAATADELFDFTFKINNDQFTIPSDIDAFTNAGWSFPANFDAIDKTVTPSNLETTYLENGDNWFNVEIFNADTKEIATKDCPIGRVTYDFSGDIEIYTSGDFLLNGKTAKDVIARYGKPLSEAEYGGYTEIIYDADPDDSIYDRYTFRFDDDSGEIIYFDIINFDM